MTAWQVGCASELLVAVRGRSGDGVRDAKVQGPGAKALLTKANRMESCRELPHEDLGISFLPI